MSYTVIQGSEIDIQNNNKTRNSHSYVRLHYWSSIWNNYFFGGGGGGNMIMLNLFDYTNYSKTEELEILL